MNNLKTNNGQIVEVIGPGQYNTNAGPDFFNARLMIDGTLWAGNVEIHIYASDWQRHQHHMDPAYDSCILHVVYDNDASTLRMNGSPIPVIELKSRLPSYLWENYLKLIGTRGWIPCQHRLHEIDEVTWRNTIDKMIIERIESKVQQILIALKGNKEDWEECFYQHLSRNFGFQLNAMPFEMLSRSLPLRIIRKERNRLIDIEALLFGQAGMLSEELNENYPMQLSEIYRHMSKKYSLKNIPFSSWKLLRLRPYNFPALRLAQLAVILMECPTLFTTLTDLSSFKKIISIFEVEASEYWNTHYHFNKSSLFKIKKLGNASIQNIMINTCIPFIYAWGKYNGVNDKMETALSFLRLLPAEDNHLIKRWKDLGAVVHTSVDTQALMQLKLLHCAEKKCLTCNIGNRLITV